SRMLNDTPLANRSVLDLAVTVGNVTGDVGSADPLLGGGTPLPGYNLQANGGRAGSTNLLADGISNTGVGLAREAVSFSPETVQEFTVQTNGFDAQYGNTTQLPAHFSTTPANSFNILDPTGAGFKYYEI